MTVSKEDVYIDEADIHDEDNETECRELWTLQLQYDVFNSFDMLDSIDQVIFVYDE